MSKSREIYVCDCDSPEHIICVQWDEPLSDEAGNRVWDVLYFYMTAGEGFGFWKRVLLAIKYVVGRVKHLESSVYVCLNDEEVHRMEKQCREFLARHRKE